ncbi:hypothetical protein EP7_002718 [Isosphaeraceae bacterium EP7]
MRPPLPLVFTVLSRTVAKVDLIGLVVRMRRHCPAASSKPSNAARSPARHSVAFGAFA